MQSVRDAVAADLKRWIGMGISSSAMLRYAANQHPGVVFATGEGTLDVSLENGQPGEFSRASIRPYRPNGGYLAEVHELIERDDDNPTLGTVRKAEVFTSVEAARAWIERRGVELDEYDTVNIDAVRPGL